jgi:ATP-binding cassette subfamily B (MDR/TAP) protein 1
MQSKDKKDAKKPEEKKESKVIGFFELFKYATGGQKILIFMSFIFAIGHGLMMPVFSVIFGKITEDFTPDKSDAEIEDQAAESALIMALVGVLAFFLAGLGVSMWKYIGNRITATLKKLYFQKILE